MLSAAVFCNIMPGSIPYIHFPPICSWRENIFFEKIFECFSSHVTDRDKSKPEKVLLVTYGVSALYKIQHDLHH